MLAATAAEAIRFYRGSVVAPWTSRAGQKSRFCRPVEWAERFGTGERLAEKAPRGGRNRARLRRLRWLRSLRRHRAPFRSRAAPEAAPKTFDMRKRHDTSPRARRGRPSSNQMNACTITPAHTCCISGEHPIYSRGRQTACALHASINSEVSMPALQVRDFPPDLYTQLKERAEQEHRSVAQQTIVAIESYLQQQLAPEQRPLAVIQGGGLTGDLARAQKRQRLYARINGFPKVENPEDFPDEAELLRQCREERDRQLMSAIGQGDME